MAREWALPARSGALRGRGRSLDRLHRASLLSASAIGRGRIVAFAVACGLAVGNLYYAQPLLAEIGAAFRVDETAAGLVVTVTQVGYAVGLLAIVPLGDLVENRRLVLTIFAGTALALVAGVLAPTYAAFLAASLAIGVTSVVAQVLVPLAANLAPEDARGRVVGQVMSGLIAGILLARAAAGAVAGIAGWRAIYGISAVLMLVTIGVLARAVPVRVPTYDGDYASLMRSLLAIFRAQPILRRRILYQAAMFGAFSAFWTTVTFRLVAAPFRFSPGEIGAFALVGASGALIAPVAGRLGDAGHGRAITGAAFGLGAAGFALALVPGNIWTLGIGAIAIDVAVQANLVAGQQAIYALDPEARSRLNTLYVGLFFFGGAAGSALSSLAFAHAGWPGVVGLGVALPLAGLAVWLTEPRPLARPDSTFG